MASYTGIACATGAGADCKLYKLGSLVTANTMSKSVKHEFSLQNPPEYCYFVSQTVQAAVIVSIPPLYHDHSVNIKTQTPQYHNTYTTQNELGILEYGCRYACAWIYDTSQMKWFALFLGEQKYLQSTK